MSETSEGGRAELKSAVIAKILQLTETEGLVSEASVSMRSAVHQTCLPGIVRTHILDAVWATATAVRAVTEAQISQMKQAAAANGMDVTDTDLVEAMREEPREPVEILPEQEFAVPQNDPPPDEKPSKGLSVGHARHGKKAKRKHQRKAS